MSAVRLSSRPVPVLAGATENLMRLDLVEEDSGRCACSIVFDRRLETDEAVWRRARLLRDVINEGSAT